VHLFQFYRENIGGKIKEFIFVGQIWGNKKGQRLKINNLPFE
jgi:hypothetical protein